MGWDIMDVLESLIGKCATITSPSGNLENVYIKNVLLDKRNYNLKEILYVEDKGRGETCLYVAEFGAKIVPNNEKPLIKGVDTHESIQSLAGDSNG
jgi:hypothetical protein